MNDNKNLLAFLLGVFLGLVVGLGACWLCEQFWRQEMVKRGNAEYSQATGQWQWKDVAK